MGAITYVAAVRPVDCQPLSTIYVKNCRSSTLLAPSLGLGLAYAFGEWPRNVNAIACAFQPGGPSSNLPPEYPLSEARPRLIELARCIKVALCR